MSAVTASLCSTLLFVLFVPTDQKIITADSGQDISLTCRAPNNKIMVVEWSRTDLGDDYVFLYQDGHIVPYAQHPSFKNRVDLQDRQMKDGDVSLILKDVTVNDTGTYECRVFMVETHSWELIIVYLHVVPPDQRIAIRTKSGQNNVTLTCRAPNNNIKVVKWIRADLEDKHVLSFENGQFDPDSQHPSFKNRVDLQDRQNKAGDVSLILKDVTTDDTGTYKCHVSMTKKNRTKRDIHVNHISTIYLRVVDRPGQTGGHTEDGSVGLKVGFYGLVSLLIVVIAFAGILIYRKLSRGSNEHPADQQSAQPLQTLLS